MSKAVQGAKIFWQIEAEKILSGDIDDGIFLAETVIEKKKFGWPIKFYYSENDVIAFFDPKISINKQIEKVEKKLNKFRKDLRKKGKLKVTNTKKRKEKWTLYLRLLDARRDQVKISDIGNFFFKDVPNEYPDFDRNDRVKKRLKRARKWVNYDYKKIAVI